MTSFVVVVVYWKSLVSLVGGECFMKTKCIKHFTPHYPCSPWSTENVFHLTKIFSCPKHPKVEKTFSKNVFTPKQTGP
jgi:hypothetical protein